ncbi:MAG: Circadian oscillation regulator KaiB [Conexibacter sp.]|nr:Circadian oscillation regulator KaiB [Conexibacter sp.]
MTTVEQRREYELTLYVNGASDRSARAIADARALLDLHLAGRHRLLIVDVNDEPAAFLRSGVLAAPALVRDHPLPARRIVGDLSDTQKVLTVLDLLRRPAPPSEPSRGR